MKKLYSAMLFAIAATATMAQTPIWSNDFSDPSTWTMGNLNGATGSWVIGTTAPSGSFAIPAIASTTAANGFALYDSDLLCDLDNAYIRNTDPIDLSNHPYVLLQFQEYYRNYQGQTFVDVSNNGVDWTTTQVNSALASNAFTDNPTLISIPITATAGGQSTVYIRFRYVGNCDYSWMVDDVAIVPQPDHDLSLVGAASTTWDFNTAYTFDSINYSIFPVSELRPRALNMTIVNNGAQPATNVTAQITSPDGYSASENLGTLASGDTFHYFAPLYTPTSTLGDHDLYYNVNSDEADANMTDNADTLVVKVSSYVYARDEDSRDGEINDTDNGDAFKIGNKFYANVEETVYGIDVAFSSASDVNVELNAQILDADADDFPALFETGFYSITYWDRTPLGGNQMVHFYFDPPVQLTAGSDYMAVVQHFGGANVIVATSGISEAQTSNIYSGSQSDWFYTTTTPMVRLNFNPTIGIDESDFSNGIGMGQNYPNPSKNGNTRIDVSLQQSTHLNMVLRDVSGKLVQTLEEGTMAPGVHHVDVNTNNLGAGVYFYTLTTNNMVSTKRMTVVR